MELKDITTTFGFFWDHSGQFQERADQEQAIYAFWVLRGGTYNDNADWFRRLCAQSPLDWRTTCRLTQEELHLGHRVNVE